MYIIEYILHLQKQAFCHLTATIFTMHNCVRKYHQTFMTFFFYLFLNRYIRFKYFQVFFLQEHLVVSFSSHSPGVSHQQESKLPLTIEYLVFISCPCGHLLLLLNLFIILQDHILVSVCLLGSNLNSEKLRPS